MKGWWCVRYGDALAWVEAPSEAAAVRRSLGLHPLGDWSEDWLHTAAAQGEATAEAGRDVVAAFLTKSQMAEALQRANEYARRYGTRSVQLASRLTVSRVRRFVLGGRAGRCSTSARRSAP